MPSRKRHLMTAGGRTACGLTDPAHWSFDPAEVTCIGCARTLKMADAEVAKVQKITKK